MNLKTLIIASTIGVSIWGIVVALYSMYAFWMINQGESPVAQLDYKAAIVSTYNYGLPIAVGCLAFLLYSRSADPVTPEVFMLTALLVFGAALLVHKASPDALGPHSKEILVRSVWWMPKDESAP